MLERKALAQFENWHKYATNHALLVTGARQVGKSYLLTEFANKYYQNVVYFDLVARSDIRNSFSQAESPEDLLLRIELLADTPLVPKETIIVIDEVQECPNVITFIKYLLDQKVYRFALSGSLLGVQLENIRSFPVGYVTEVPMYPLDFEEFTWAMGASKNAYALVTDCVQQNKPIPDYLHDRMLNLFRKYLLVGGMPDAASTFTNQGQIDTVRTIQNDIRRQYSIDISKYAPKNHRLIIQDIFNRIPAQLLQQNRRFKISDLQNIKRYNQVAADFLWLTAAGVAIPVYNVSAPAFPLEINEQRTLFKLYSNDVGLISGVFSKKDLVGFLDGKPPANLGGIYENFITQELVSRGIKPWYFTKKSLGEIDFLFQRANGGIVALESKSGRNYYAHKSLDDALTNKDYHIDEAYVLAECNVSKEERVTYLPIYAISCLQE